MKKNLLYYILISSFHFGNSQNNEVNTYTIDYVKTINFESGGSFSASHTYTRFIELNKSIFNVVTNPKEVKSSEENQNSLVESDDDDTVFYFKPTGKNISLVYKDYLKQELFSKHEVSYKYFVVQDTLDLFNWEIIDTQKDILGYSCQLAKMNFRGRDYEAWFATTLPTGGPWKYDGLPGMILEITSVDNFISFKATSIKNGYIELKNLENPLSKEKVLTWQEFTELYKIKAVELMSYRPTENSFGVETSRGGIETYITEDDVDYNNALEKMKKQ
ncbi:GLPGLI family protein [Psychroserpens burtonensis]|uniref:GLPGLI family protein n=1 Tax=Psychroserpens burtonensis TaxID=49278 RepID=A0A5C7BFU6_9FLAO|nr:GLPGLI family protein [Psychroserpens burtonensis]TXE18346.1 GLPGLI family protein [Psychroserpens burtonensis]